MQARAVRVGEVEVGGTFLAPGRAAEQHQLAVGGERWAILAVHPPRCDATSIRRRADRLDEHGTVLLRAVASADEGEQLAVRRERRVRGLECKQPPAT